MLYDVPTSWSPEQILTNLSTWDQVIAMSLKSQRKYYTIRLKIAFNQFTLQAFYGGKWYHRLHTPEVRWFPGRWTLKQRNNHATFAAKVEGLPVSVTADPLLTQDYDKRDFFFKDQDICAYKFSKKGTGRVMILGFFETYEDLKTALKSPFIYERTEYRWYCSNGRPNKKKSKKASSRSSQKRTSQNIGTKGSPLKPSSKPEGSRRASSKSSSKNKQKKAGKTVLDKVDLKLVLSLLD
ncbi:hypothetical protein RclHR1_03390011 [Rhizophagus clarus]|uniref:Uncharacterized protein n=1 Tax=Rhizophagus clarus TaxID=94130 RepID=A0A2Z6R9K2_9GLOM|nr:hypothetical protein RclHR1_03390011 [Rhizophagus clarus]GES85160.1 hypothetical protein GLOIN_2v1765605 [Rhizophagus clarus]